MNSAELKRDMEELIVALEDNPHDTAPELIKANRAYDMVEVGGGYDSRGKYQPAKKVKGIGKLHNRRNEWIQPSHPLEVPELVDKLHCYYRYFDEGFKTEENIDTLGDEIVVLAKKIITEV